MGKKIVGKRGNKKRFASLGDRKLQHKKKKVIDYTMLEFDYVLFQIVEQIRSNVAWNNNIL